MAALFSCNKHPEDANPNPTQIPADGRETSLSGKLAKGFSRYMETGANRTAFYGLIPLYEQGFGEQLFVSLLDKAGFANAFMTAYNGANGTTETQTSLKAAIFAENPFLGVRIRSVFKNNAEHLRLAVPLIQNIQDQQIYKAGLLVDNDLEVDNIPANSLAFTIDIVTTQSQKFVNVATKTILYEPNLGEYDWMMQPEVIQHITAHCHKVQADVYVADVIEDMQDIAKTTWFRPPPPNPPIEPPLSPCARDDNNESNAYLSFKLQSVQALLAFGNNPCEFGTPLKGLFVGNINNLSGTVEEFYDFKIVTQWAVPSGSVGGSTSHKIFLRLFELVDRPTYTTSYVNGGPYGNYLVYTVQNPGFTTTLDVPLSLPLFAAGDTWVASTWDPSLIGDQIRISMFESDPCTWNYQTGTSEVTTNTTTYQSTITANFAKYANLVVGGSQQISHSNTTNSTFSISSSNNYEIGSILYHYCWSTNIHEVKFGNILKLKINHLP